ncbi:sulfurtransferase [Calothrix sp. UHCC 0171]|uniref:sulfurtransferase n=1 Tax=Calothrix sp. UHCC 0171 TaxID=3110245 RepID=UPI002B1F7D2A|nr:sulfurtransferase [Calothrix sp. UHCC 0171]MEA5572256.1 sulfurtransferase [Calothrix sp. UHCC 0171]
MTNDSCVVSAQWLLEHINNPQVVIVDCRFSLADAQLGKQQYQTSHISGAYYLDLNLDLSSPITEHGGRHPLPDIEKFSKKLANIGVNSQTSNSQATLVVAYDDSRLAFASRLWWLMRYLGHEQVAVLDGGFAGWLLLDYPVTDAIPPQKTADFTPKLQPQMMVDFSTIKTRKDLPGIVLVDSRESDRYLGIREPIDKIAGHIPGAVNYPWQDVTNANGYLYPQEQQQQRWQEIQDSQEIVVYCGSGVTACVNLLSLELAGISNYKLYPGSWSDWISY